MYPLTNSIFMKSNLEKIKGMLKGARAYQVSPELDHKILRAIGMSEAAPHVELESEVPLLPFNWLTPWLMKSFKQFAVAVVAIVLMLGGSWFYTQNSYAYHLGKAKAALADLQSVLGGKPIAQNSFIGQAFAEDSVLAATVNEAQVVNLSQTVVIETEKAIEIASNKTDPATVQQALAEVVAVQDQSVPVLAAAAEAVTTAEATQMIASALQATAADQTLVIRAKVFVATASANGEKQVSIEIQTTSDAKPTVTTEEKTDESRLADAKAEYQDAKALIEKLKAAGADVDLIAKLQSKLDKVVAAFEGGKIGRAHGLSTALEAQGKHLMDKDAREKKEKKDKKDKEEEDKQDEKDSEDKDDEDKKSGEEEKTDEQKSTEAKANIEAAKALIEQAKTAKVDQKSIDKVQSKIDKAQAALDGKNSEAYGLSVDALSKAKKLIGEVKEDKDGKKNDDDKNKDEEDKDEDGEKRGEEITKPALPSVPKLDKGEKDSDRSSGNRDEEKSEEDDD